MAGPTTGQGGKLWGQRNICRVDNWGLIYLDKTRSAGTTERDASGTQRPTGRVRPFKS